MLKFSVEIEGSNWRDVQSIELVDAPEEGETIQTNYGTCVVVRVDAGSADGDRAGTIVCRMP